MRIVAELSTFVPASARGEWTDGLLSRFHPQLDDDWQHIDEKVH